MWLCHKLGKESNNGIFAEDKIPWHCLDSDPWPFITNSYGGYQHNIC